MLSHCKQHLLWTGHKQNKTHQNSLGLSFQNYLWLSQNKPSVHRVRCEKILALHAVFAHCWCPTPSNSSITSYLPVPACCVSPRVIILVRAAVNRLHTVSPVFKQASVGLRACVQYQSDVQPCSLRSRSQVTGSRLQLASWLVSRSY